MKKAGIMAGVAAAAAAVVLMAAGAATVSAAENLKGTAYISGHGGHLAVVDLATWKAPVDEAKDRIVITEAGSEMEGQIAGMSFEEVKKGGGSHGSARVGDTLVVGLLNGNVVNYDLKTGKKSAPMQVGKKFCDAIVGPDGNIYLEDMADGHVYVWDPKGLKVVDKFPVGAAVCGIAWTKTRDKAYVSDMPTGKVYVLDWKTKKTIKEITDPEMTFIHQVIMAPDEKSLWVSAPNEFDPGLKPGTHKSQIVVIDTTTDTVTERIVLPDDVRPHDFEFTPSGKSVLIAARTYKDDSLLLQMDLATKKIDKRVSLCLACHKENGVEVTIDNKSPLLCGVVVDWKK